MSLAENIPLRDSIPRLFRVTPTLSAVETVAVDRKSDGSADELHLT